MQFWVNAGSTAMPSVFVEPAIILTPTRWDDWYEFETTYSVQFYAQNVQRGLYIGETKIGSKGLQPSTAKDAPADAGSRGIRRVNPPINFKQLPTGFFSLAQSPEFYKRLTDLSGEIRDSVLAGLRDIAFDPNLRGAAYRERVTSVSLMRFVTQTTVEEEFARLARGGAELTSYDFSFQQIDEKRKKDSYKLKFEVQPSSFPPTNIHVLVGRNGVGKSTLLHDMAKAAAFPGTQQGGVIYNPDLTLTKFPNVITVSFSAFDEFEPVAVARERALGVSAEYIGLKKTGSEGLKDRVAIASDLTRSAKLCLSGDRLVRWKRALTFLEADPIFREMGLSEKLGSLPDRDQLESDLPKIFKRLSSGHKIVLLTITRLVQSVSEKTLVLNDEPEAHLHPPLLSAYVRALSDLMTATNGVAVIATHSPVVLQEVPARCVWQLSRSGWRVASMRPQRETFGESVGTLTDDVFGLEVTDTGYHRLLTDSVFAGQTYEDILHKFEGQIGAEGRILLRSAFLAKNNRQS